jgi:SAM-dependent methyltransferase
MMRRETPDIETSSAAYAGRFSGAVGEWFLHLQADTSRELLQGLAPRARVLDVGGGHAQLTPMLVEQGFDVTVAASDPACAHRLSGWIARGECRFQTGDLLHLPFDDRGFDAVISVRLLPHMTAWRELTRELCRLSRHAVLVDYPSTRSINVLAGGLFGLKKRVEGDTRPFALFSPADIESEFARHEFRVSAARPEFFFPMALHRLAGSAGLARALEAGPRALGLTARFGSPVIVRADRVRG